MDTQDVIRLIAQFDASGIKTGADESAAAFAKMIADMSAQITALETKIATLEETIRGIGSRSSSSFNSLERAAAQAGGRIAGADAGLGMLGSSLGRVAAYLPGIGEAFALAFPLALLGLVVDKAIQYEQEIEKSSKEVEEFAISSAHSADSIGKENLQLEDQIRKLENRPTRNALAIALMEAKDAAASLSKNLEDATEKANSALNIGTLGEIFNQLNPWGKKTANESQYSDKMKPILDQIQNDRLKLAQLPADAKPDQVNGVLDDQIGLYKKLANQIESDIQYMQAGQGSSDRFSDSIRRFSNELIGANEAIRSLQEQKVQDVLKGAAGSLTQTHDNLDYWKKFSEGFDEAERAITRADQTWKEFENKRVSEAEKTQQELSKIDAEGAKENAAILDRVSRERTESDINSAEQDVSAIEKLFQDMQTNRQAALKGQSGVFAQVAGQQQSASELGALQSALPNVQDAIQRTANSIAQLNAQPFLSDADQQNLQKYESELNKLNQLLDRMKSQIGLLQAENQTFTQQLGTAWESTWNGAFNSFNQNFTKMIAGGESFTRVMQGLWTSLVDGIVTQILQMGEKWITEHVLMAAASKLLGTAGASAQAAGLAAKLAIDKASVTSSAGVAAAGAFASQAPIPFVGPELGQAAATAAFTEVMSFNAFEKGGLVPETGMAQLHKNEMVLPQSLSQFMQTSAAKASGTKDGAGQPISLHYAPQISAIDANGVHDMLKKHSAIFAAQIASYLRSSHRI